MRNSRLHHWLPTPPRCPPSPRRGSRPLPARTSGHLTKLVRYSAPPNGHLCRSLGLLAGSELLRIRLPRRSVDRREGEGGPNPSWISVPPQDFRAASKGKGGSTFRRCDDEAPDGGRVHLGIDAGIASRPTPPAEVDDADLAPPPGRRGPQGAAGIALASVPARLARGDREAPDVGGSVGVSGPASETSGTV